MQKIHQSHPRVSCSVVVNFSPSILFCKKKKMYCSVRVKTFITPRKKLFLKLKCDYHGKNNVYGCKQKKLKYYESEYQFYNIYRSLFK